MDVSFHIATYVLRRLPIVAVFILVACGTPATVPVQRKDIPVTFYAPTRAASVSRVSLSTTKQVALPTAGAAAATQAPIAPATLAVPQIAVTDTPLPLTAVPKSSSPTSGEAADLAAQMLTLHNKLRAQNGLADYTVSDQLQQAAQRHADWLVTKPAADLFNLGPQGHIGEGDSDIVRRVADTGYNAAAVSENWVFNDLEGAFEFWSTDVHHKPQVMSSDFKEIGIGVTKHSSGFGFVFVAVYARRN